MSGSLSSKKSARRSWARFSFSASSTARRSAGLRLVNSTDASLSPSLAKPVMAALLTNGSRSSAAASNSSRFLESRSWASHRRSASVVAGLGRGLALRGRNSFGRMRQILPSPCSSYSRLPQSLTYSVPSGAVAMLTGRKLLPPCTSGCIEPLTDAPRRSSRYRSTR